MLNDELSKAIYFSSSFKFDYYKLRLENFVRNNIETKGFENVDYKINLDYKAISHLLMGENIYGDKRYGLRELIQNAVDACLCKKEIEDSDDNYKVDDYTPRIKIILDKNVNKVKVLDNGIGMTGNVLKNYFFTIGKSYYKSNDYLFQGNKYSPIGRYGIGFLSCFMLSNNVDIETKSYKETKSHHIKLNNNDEYINYKISDLKENKT